MKYEIDIQTTRERPMEWSKLVIGPIDGIDRAVSITAETFNAFDEVVAVRIRRTKL